MFPWKKSLRFPNVRSESPIGRAIESGDPFRIEHFIVHKRVECARALACCSKSATTRSASTKATGSVMNVSVRTTAVLSLIALASSTASNEIPEQTGAQLHEVSSVWDGCDAFRLMRNAAKERRLRAQEKTIEQRYCVIQRRKGEAQPLSGDIRPLAAPAIASIRERPALRRD